jgi:hypothetical protein
MRYKQVKALRYRFLINGIKISGLHSFYPFVNTVVQIIISLIHFTTLASHPVYLIAYMEHVPDIPKRSFHGFMGQSTQLIVAILG